MKEALWEVPIYVEMERRDGQKNEAIKVEGAGDYLTIATKGT